MIRNVVLHMLNDQPIMADLFEVPSPNHNGIVCTNVRTMAGRRPTFVDAIDATFVFPYLHIRFIEIPSGATDGRSQLAASVGVAEAGPELAPEPKPELDLELDEAFLTRIRDA